MCVMQWRLHHYIRVHKRVARPDVPCVRTRRLALKKGPLRGIAEIRRFFRTNETPVYFVSRHGVQPARHRSLGAQLQVPQLLRLVRRAHPNVFVPKEQTPRAFESIEEICNYLLGHKEVVDLVRGARAGGKAAFLMFDEETEQLAGELGLEVAFPSAALRHRLDSKIETTRLGNEAGVPSVPNTMGRATDYGALLRARARRRASATTSSSRPRTATPGRPRSSSPTRTTGGEHEKKIVGERAQGDERIEPRECAIEGVITRHGTLVGPLMAELTGFPELTPYDGGWCGNDVFPEVLTERQRVLARERTFAMGERLRTRGTAATSSSTSCADADTGEM